VSAKRRRGRDLGQPSNQPLQQLWQRGAGRVVVTQRDTSHQMNLDVGGVLPGGGDGERFSLR